MCLTEPAISVIDPAQAAAGRLLAPDRSEARASCQLGWSGGTGDQPVLSRLVASSVGFTARK